MGMGGLLFEKESYAIRGAVYEVYRAMGSGFLEAVYQECLERELNDRDIPFDAQKELQLYYKGKKLKKLYKADFICYKKIIIELKTVKQVTDEHRAQLFNYLKASGFRLGLLVNFGNYPKATVERIVV
jgi:GxxExxY protein